MGKILYSLDHHGLRLDVDLGRMARILIVAVRPPFGFGREKTIFET
jgi:hypothetical protein